MDLRQNVKTITKYNHKVNWMGIPSLVNQFCHDADSATSGYPADALGLRTIRFHRQWAQTDISWRYNGLCLWGSIV